MKKKLINFNYYKTIRKKEFIFYKDLKLLKLKENIIIIIYYKVFIHIIISL